CWKTQLELPFTQANAALQRLQSALVALHDATDIGNQDFYLGGFPSGKRVTVAVSRSSSFTLEPPPIDGAAAIPPAAESVFATASFHVFKRQVFALSGGVAVGGLFNNRFREYALALGDNDKIVLETRNDAFLV